MTGDDDRQLGIPFQATSATSLAAAEQVAPALHELQRRVLVFIKEHPGCTDEVIADGLRLNPSTARPRRIELARRGLIVEAGEGRTRSGRRAVTWKAAA